MEQSVSSSTLPIDDDWDAADGGISSLRRKNGSESPSPTKISTLDAENWLLLNRQAAQKKRSKSPENNEEEQWFDTEDELMTKDTPDTLPSPSSNPIPIPYVSTIVAAFGHDTDLYRDVLRVPKDSTSREIRIAYFRRGREVLTGDDACFDDHHQFSNPASSQRSLASSTAASAMTSAITINGEISDHAKVRFQAVSMAYEVLSNPTWKAFYDEYGLQSESIEVVLHHPLPDDEVQSVQSTPNLRKVSRYSSNQSNDKKKQNHNGLKPSDANSSRPRGTVRWSDQVEELIFSRDPLEMEPKDLFGSKKKKSRHGYRSLKRKSSRRKHRVVVETAAMHEHLDKIDQRAEKHFVSDLLDDIESSIEDLWGMNDKDAELLADNLSTEAVGSLEAKPQGEDRNDRDVDENHLATTNNYYSENKKQESNPPLQLPRQQPVMMAPPAPEALFPQRQFEEESEEDRELIEIDQHCRTQQMLSSDETISTLSASVVDKKDPFTTRQEEAVTPLSESDANDTETNPISTSFESSFTNDDDDDGGDYDELNTGRVEDDAVGCEPWCGGTVMDYGSEGRVFVTVHDGSEASEAPGFYVFLMTYLKSLADDLYGWGSTLRESLGDWDMSGMMETVKISEEDLEGMLGILQNELQEDDIPQETNKASSSPIPQGTNRGSS